MNLLVIEKGSQRKRVTEVSWHLMGAADAKGEKNGWKIVADPSRKVSNEVPQPPTGQKSSAKVVTAKVTNEVAPAESPAEEATKISNEVQQPSDPKEPAQSHEQFAPEFLELAKANLKRPDLKNYFDANKIEYKQNASTDSMFDMLANHLHGDIELLKTEFSI